MNLGLTLATAACVTHQSVIAFSGSHLSRTTLKPVEASPKIFGNAPSSFQTPALQNRLIALNDLAPHQSEPSKNKDLEHKDLEVVQFNRTAHFITEDGYPLDIFTDNNLAELDLSDLNSLYKLKYNLNHDDRTGHRTLHIADHFQVDESFYGKMMRDTVYAEWTEDNGKPVLNVFMHVNDNAKGQGPAWESGTKNSDLIPKPLGKELAKIGGEMRKNIFKAHIQDSLQAIVLGTKPLLEHHPELNNADTKLFYLSELPEVDETINFGPLSKSLDKPVLSHPAPLAQFTNNLAIWGDALALSTKAMNQLLDTLIQPKILGPLISNPKTLLPTVVILVALSIMTANSKSDSSQ